MLTNNVQVNDCDCIGQTPLFYAVSHCQSGDLVPVLLKSGWSVETVESTTTVSPGVNVNAQRSSDGWTALHVAAMVGRLEVASLLLQVTASGRWRMLISAGGGRPAAGGQRWPDGRPGGGALPAQDRGRLYQQVGGQAGQAARRSNSVPQPQREVPPAVSCRLHGLPQDQRSGIT